MRSCAFLLAAVFSFVVNCFSSVVASKPVDGGLHFRRNTCLSDYIPGHPALLANLESKGFSLVEDLFNWEAEGWVLRPWLEVKQSYHEQPCACYIAL